MTLFDWIKGKLSKPQSKVELPPEMQFYNPLSLHNGQSFVIDHPDFGDDMEFKIIGSLIEYNNIIGGEDHKFFTCNAQCYVNNALRRIQLRVEPDPQASKESGLDFNILVLRVHEEESRREFEAKEGVDLYQIVELDPQQSDYRKNEEDKRPRFQVMSDDGAVTAEYLRLGGNKTSLVPSVREFSVNADGTLNPSSGRRIKCEYWDYSRETKDNGGTSFNEYLIVELWEKAWWKIWIGQQIDSTRIKVHG